MNLEFLKPQMHQSQKIIMGYLMKRSLHILKLSNLELKEYLYSEIEKNPILDIKMQSNTNYNQKNKNTILHSLKYNCSLFEHLILQAKEIFENKTDLYISENIIGNLDSKGYFTSDIDTFAKDIKQEPSKVSEILKIIKTFEPKGIAVKNLQERILQQLNNPDSLEYQIIEKYFPLILKNKINKIAQKLKVDVKKIQVLLETTFKNIIFDPTVNFSDKIPIGIHPDIIIYIKEGKWFIEIEEDLPFFEINKPYLKLLENKNNQSYKNYLFAANFLMKNILVRRKTLQDICSYIIQKQKLFLLGKGPLISITIKETANFLQLNISTVSRAIMNKYIQCPLGLLPMKSFFLKTSKNKQNLKHLEEILEKILMEENKKKPLSDFEIKKKLEEKGFFLNRRTICKYRKKLNIGTLHQRKKWF